MVNVLQCGSVQGMAQTTEHKVFAFQLPVSTKSSNKIIFHKVEFEYPNYWTCIHKITKYNSLLGKTPKQPLR